MSANSRNWPFRCLNSLSLCHTTTVLEATAVAGASHGPNRPCHIFPKNLPRSPHTHTHTHTHIHAHRLSVVAGAFTRGHTRLWKSANPFWLIDLAFFSSIQPSVHSFTHSHFTYLPEVCVLTLCRFVPYVDMSISDTLSAYMFQCFHTFLGFSVADDDYFAWPWWKVLFFFSVFQAALF